ncbi:MAG: SCO family protein [Gammaproteobacteria bacterium]|nr:SCO family protein [Gammaproteobacteria bacterium]
MSRIYRLRKYLELIFLSLLFFFVISKNALAAENPQINGTYLTKPISINDFHLTDQHGNPFTKENLKGHWSMMFFGFTNCGYVCPVTLTELNHMYHDLKKTLLDKDLPTIIFVTVDPERDSIPIMKKYMNSFDNHFIGAQAEITETEKLENQLHITAVKIHEKDQPKDEYIMNHSVEILLFNPKAELQAYLAYPHKSKQMEKDYKLILKISNNKMIENTSSPLPH